MKRKPKKPKGESGGADRVQKETASAFCAHHVPFAPLPFLSLNLAMAAVNQDTTSVVINQSNNSGLHIAMYEQVHIGTSKSSPPT